MWNEVLKRIDSAETPKFLQILAGVTKLLLNAQIQPGHFQKITIPASVLMMLAGKILKMFLK